MIKNVFIISFTAILVFGNESRWIAIDSGNWNNRKNWHVTETPNYLDHDFILSNDPLLPPTLSLTDHSALRALKLDYSWEGAGYVIDSVNGAGLTFDGSSESTLIQVTNAHGNGYHRIKCPITLAKPLVIDQGSKGNLTVSGVIHEIGHQSLIKKGPQTLILSAPNEHSAGTVIEEGILSISSDANLGLADAPLSIADATLVVTQDIPLHAPSKRPTILNAEHATIDTQNNVVAFSGPVLGEGGLVKKGEGTLIFTGENSYVGSTLVESGVLKGDAKALRGEITSKEGTTVVFDQATNGTYAGSFKGKGSLVKEEDGLLQIIGDHSTFEGTTLVKQGELKLNGSLANSSLTVKKGAILSGNGIFGSTAIEKEGMISPGNSIGTQKYTSLDMSAGSIVNIEFSPSETSLVQVDGIAKLNGSNLLLTNQEGFYGFKTNHTIVTSGGLNGTTFGPVFSANPNLLYSLSYTLNNVMLTITAPHPFLNFPFTMHNAEKAATNLDELYNQSLLTTDLLNIVNSFGGQSNQTIENALDQMQPASYSAATEMQAEARAQLVSLFRQTPFNNCKSSGSWEVWAKPYFNALDIDNEGEQIGFDSTTAGFAVGFDKQISDTISLGAGGAWDRSHISLHSNRGFSDLDGFYGALYADYESQNWLLGTTFLSGLNFTDATRHIEFLTTHRTANTDYHILNVVAQLRSAYFFDYSLLQFYPYAHFDFLYLQEGSFEEKNAEGLNLHVDSRHNSTFRTELGLTLQKLLQYDTFCMEPNCSLGWVNMVPVSRSDLKTNFFDAPITFSVEGWDKTWNLISFDAALNATYESFNLNLEYNLEISPTDSFVNQYATLTFAWRW
jgi:outer membrane autotransporter protein